MNDRFDPALIEGLTPEALPAPTQLPGVLKYSRQINDGFERLGFEPRAGQREIIDEILRAFVDDEMQNVVLNAPTGTGKSIIGAVTAEALTTVLGKPTNETKSSLMLTATNVLSGQYAVTFRGLGDKFLCIKGAANFGCAAVSTKEKTADGGACVYSMLLFSPDLQPMIKAHCNGCSYLAQKKKRNKVRHTSTSYAYYLNSQLYAGPQGLEERDLTVWDEAHLVPDLVSDHNAIHLSQTWIEGVVKEVKQVIPVLDAAVAKILGMVAADCADPGKISEATYPAYLKALHKVYAYAADQGNELAEKARDANQMAECSRMMRFRSKYQVLANKIADFFRFNYEHVFDAQVETATVAVKPIFVGSFISALQPSQHHLFMSATISEAFALQTLNLAPARTRFIGMPPSFPAANKEIVFYDPIALSFKSLQQPETVTRLRKNAAAIVKQHIEAGERGIVLAPSFKLQVEIVAELREQPWLDKYRLFEHRQGEKLVDVLAEFKAYTGGAAVLISPAIFEGVDLPGDMSRFQILLKAPFPSLGDKRMAYIAKRYPDLYSTLTVMKMVQGAGRSVRSSEDQAVTYILDRNAERIFDSSSNIWRDEFLVRLG